MLKEIENEKENMKIKDSKVWKCWSVNKRNEREKEW